MVHRLLDLRAILTDQHLALDQPLRQQRVREIAVVLRRIGSGHPRQIVRGDRTDTHQTIAETISAIHQFGVHDAAARKVHGTEAALTGDAETATLLAKRQQLQHIGQ